LQVRVQTLFLPDKSWVAQRILTSGLASRVGIRHEQVHFDLAEVYARRMRKLFRELRDPCRHSDAALVEMAEQVLKELGTAQRRYDIDTENGQLEAKQNDWERNVAGELKALAAFAS
jgi:predicted secreted Zn-dependent protease